jgi:hypothetical protein
LPQGLEYLVINCNYNHCLVDLNHLPPLLKYLSLVGINYYYGKLDFLPIGLKCLVIPQYYNGDLRNLPPTLEILDLYGGYERRIEELPASIKTIIVSSHKGYDIAYEYVHLVVAF